jgi:hypothetical protein
MSKTIGFGDGSEELKEDFSTHYNNFSIVFAFAGDSTITKFFAIFSFIWATKVYEFFKTQIF